HRSDHRSQLPTLHAGGHFTSAFIEHAHFVSSGLCRSSRVTHANPLNWSSVEDAGGAEHASSLNASVAATIATKPALSPRAFDGPFRSASAHNGQGGWPGSIAMLAGSSR